jgi:hypothetical protein
MKKYFISGLICLGMACHLPAQNTVDFKVEYRKGVKYSQVYDSKSHTVSTYTGNVAHINELKAKGLKNPTVSDKQMTLRCITRCFTTLANGRMIMRMQFSKAMGNSFKLPLHFDRAIHLHKYPNREPIVDSVSYKMTTDEYKKQWVPMISTMLGQMNFLNRKINVGAEVREQTVQKLPVGGQTIDMNITTIYTLKKATSDSAWLDMSVVFTFKGAPKGVKAEVKGNGKGTMVYDLKNHIIARRNIITDMTIKITEGNISVETVEHNTVAEVDKVIP